MQIRLARLLFSRAQRHRSITFSPLARLLPVAHSSSSPNRRRRDRGADERWRRDGDRSEDLFLRNLNFRDGRSHGEDRDDDDDDYKQQQQQQQRTEKGYHYQQQRRGPPDRMSSTGSIPGPLGPDPRRKEREEGSFVGGLEDIFPDSGDDESDDRTGGAHRSAPGRMPNRAMGREHPEQLGHSRQTFKEYDVHKKNDFQVPRSDSQSLFDDAFNREEPGGDPAANRGDRIGDTLLQKLNLGQVDGGEKVQEADQKTPSTAIPEKNSAAPEPPPPQDAEEIFKSMKETGLIPNAVAMLDGLCKDGLVQEAMKLFGVMRERGTIPEVVIYTAVVEGFCKAAKFDDAMRIFKKMQKNGIVPNAFSYTILIQGLNKGGKLEESVQFCLEMLDSGHLPNAATLVGLVDGFCKEKGLEHAENAVKRLQERGFVLDDKSVREYMDKKGPFSHLVWEAIFGKKKPQRPF